MQTPRSPVLVNAAGQMLPSKRCRPVLSAAAGPVDSWARPTISGLLCSKAKSVVANVVNACMRAPRVAAVLAALGVILAVTAITLRKRAWDGVKKRERDGEAPKDMLKATAAMEAKEFKQKTEVPEVAEIAEVTEVMEATVDELGTSAMVIPFSRTLSDLFIHSAKARVVPIKRLSSSVISYRLLW